MELSKDQIFPVKDRILVEVYEADVETDGGIEVVDGQQNKAPVMGTVIRVGKESVYAPDTKVMFRRYAIDELKIQTPEGEQVIFFLEDGDILATVDSGVELPTRKDKYPQIAQVREVEDQLPHANGTNKEGEEGEEVTDISAPAEEEVGKKKK